MQHKKTRIAISNNIKDYLERNNMTMTAFGKIFNVTRPTVKRWIDCDCAPELELFPSICELLNITIYEFIGVEDPNKLTEDQFLILEAYTNNVNFRNLIDRYRSDETFRNKIDKLIEQ